MNKWWVKWSKWILVMGGATSIFVAIIPWSSVVQTRQFASPLSPGLFNFEDDNTNCLNKINYYKYLPSADVIQGMLPRLIANKLKTSPSTNYINEIELLDATAAIGTGAANLNGISAPLPGLNFFVLTTKPWASGITFTGSVTLSYYVNPNLTILDQIFLKTSFNLDNVYWNYQLLYEYNGLDFAIKFYNKFGNDTSSITGGLDVNEVAFSPLQWDQIAQVFTTTVSAQPNSLKYTGAKNITVTAARHNFNSATGPTDAKAFFRQNVTTTAFLTFPAGSIINVNNAKTLLKANNFAATINPNMTAISVAAQDAIIGYVANQIEVVSIDLTNKLIRARIPRFNSLLTFTNANIDYVDFKYTVAV